MVKILNHDDPKWLDLISSHPDATIFHHPNWLRTIAESYNYKPFILAITNNKEKIECGIPIIEVNHFGLRKKWLSLPFSDYCFPLSLSNQSLEDLVDYLSNHIQTKQFPPTQIRWSLPERSGIHQHQHYVLHTTSLSTDSNQVFNKIHKKVRKYIRSSFNREVKVEWGTHGEFVRHFYDLQVITRKKHGLPPQPIKFFYLLEKNILAKGLGSILLAFHEKKLLAGLVILYWQNTLTLKYGASIIDHLQELRPNHALEWSAIQWGCENGFKKLDCGRSAIKHVGLRNYKNHWGYEEHPLFYSEIGEKAQNNLLSTPLIPKLFNTFIRLSPLWLCRKIGDAIYQFFP